MSTDEKTGMQALERLHRTKPVRPGLVERVEFEYVRHGTLSLIANFDVVTGKVALGAVGLPRALPGAPTDPDVPISGIRLFVHGFATSGRRCGRPWAAEADTASARA